MNECATSVCSANATCTNTPGAFTCACTVGYGGDGGTCTDLNECLVGNGGCGTNAMCTNVPGSRTCACGAGFLGDGGSCLADPCLTNNGGCGTRALCQPFIGGRTCTCDVGYAPDGGACLPVWVPAVLPRLRNHALAWDSARQKLMLFNASSIVGYPTWERRGTKFVPRAGPSTPQPVDYSPRSMAFDTVRQRLVLVNRGSTLEWDGNAWLLRTPTNSPPDQYNEHALVWDEVRRRVVYFGGQSDTWLWDGTDWTQVSGPAPSARSGHAMVFDRARGTVILFGGSGLNDTWEWNGTTWTQLTTTGAPPGSRRHALAYDPRRGRVVLFGGEMTGAYYSAQTWEFDGAAARWTRAMPAVSPPGRWFHAMAWDENRQRVVMLGGTQTAAASGGQLIADADCWEWDGTTWVDVTEVRPDQRSAVATYDSVRGRVVVTGTDRTISLSSLYEFDRTNWNRASTTGTTAPGVFDSSRGRSVFVSLTQTAEWSGTTWTTASPANAPTSGGVAFGYDALNSRVVAFGGSVSFSPNDETRTWNGSAWSLRSPSTRPPPRFNASMAWDPGRNQLVMYGGQGNCVSISCPYFFDTWLWNGTRWLQLSTTGAPPGGGLLTYEPARANILLVTASQTWALNGTVWRQLDVGPLPGGLSGLATDTTQNRVYAVGGYSLPYNDFESWVMTLAPP